MDEEKEKLFKKLQSEINQSILEIEQGFISRGKTL